MGEKNVSPGVAEHRREVEQIVHRIHGAVLPLGAASSPDDRAVYVRVRDGLRGLLGESRGLVESERLDLPASVLMREVQRFSGELRISLDTTRPTGRIIVCLWQDLVAWLDGRGALQARYHVVPGGAYCPVQILSWDPTRGRQTVGELVGIPACRSIVA